MFANGDQVKKSKIIPRYPNDTQPLTSFQIQTGQKENRLVKPRGVDPDFDSFLDRYGITAAEYANIHGLVEPQSGMASATYPELIFGPGGLGSLVRNVSTKKTMVPTGSSAGVMLPGGQQGPVQMIPQMAEKTKLTGVGKILTGGPAVLALSGSSAAPQEDEEQELDLVPASAIDVDLTLSDPSLQATLDSIMGTKKPAETETDLQKQRKDELSYIDALIKETQNRKAAAIQDINRRQEQKNYDNMNVYLEEISLALAEAEGDLGLGLSTGAARAAKRLGEEEREDKLAALEALSDLADEEGMDLTESNVLKISERYRDAVDSIAKQNNLRTIITEMKSAISSGGVTGISGYMSRIIDNLAGFTGIGDQIVSAATRAKEQGEYIQAQAIQAILQESGRTISDRDRQLIKQIVADLENPFMGRGRAEESLGRVLNNIRMSEESARKEIGFLKERYGQAIPQLGGYDVAAPGGAAPTTTEQEYNLDDVIPG